MRQKQSRTLGWLCVLVLGLAGSWARAADHNDAPAILPLNQVDINDIYAFRSPVNAQNTVLVMTVNPFIGVESTPQLDPNAIYTLLVDTNGDAIEDIDFTFRFSAPNGVGAQTVLLTSGRATLARGVTESNIAVRGGGTLRVGVQDDPFFFDPRVLMNGFQPLDPPVNRFGPLANVTAITLEIPSKLLRDRTVGIWGVTEVRGQQVDRMGRPGINTVLIPAARKDEFNVTEPRNDVARFRDEVINTITTVIGNGAQAAGLADFLLPDILTIDTSLPTLFPNGRGLPDDVIDIELNLLSGGAATTDGVDLDSTFSPVFPYLGAPGVIP